MPSASNWEFPPSVQPKPGDYAFDLDQALNAVVGLSAVIPADAFTAEILGTERAGNGVLIRNNVVLTIGYLITEAEAIWLTLFDGRAVQAPCWLTIRRRALGSCRPSRRPMVRPSRPAVPATP